MHGYCKKACTVNSMNSIRQLQAAELCHGFVPASDPLAHACSMYVTRGGKVPCAPHNRQFEQKSRGSCCLARPTPGIPMPSAATGQNLFLGSPEILQSTLLPLLSAVDLFQLSMTCKGLQAWLQSTPPQLWQVRIADSIRRLDLLSPLVTSFLTNRLYAGHSQLCASCLPEEPAFYGSSAFCSVEGSHGQPQDQDQLAARQSRDCAAA